MARPVDTTLMDAVAVSEPAVLVPADDGITMRAGWRRILTGQPSRSGRPSAAAGIALLLGACWVAVVLSGGRVPQLADLSYGAAVLAGLFFGVPGGAAAGATAMLLVSPLGPLDPELPLSGWLSHGLIAISLGTLVGVRSVALDRSHERTKDLALRLGGTYQNTLHLIAEAVELRDPITAGHPHRVALNARTVGTFVGLADSEVATLYWAGLLHDVGKIAVPETILQKPGRLDESEWSLMREHPGLGARLITDGSEELTPIALAVAAHHECWDGSGYPHGLAGAAIPKLARILSIVDVFEALTCSRPYRGPLDPRSAQLHRRQLGQQIRSRPRSCLRKGIRPRGDHRGRHSESVAPPTDSKGPGRIAASLLAQKRQTSSSALLRCGRSWASATESGASRLSGTLNGRSAHGAARP